MPMHSQKACTSRACPFWLEAGAMTHRNTQLSPSLHTVVFMNKIAASSLSHDEQLGAWLL